MGEIVLPRDELQLDLQYHMVSPKIMQETLNGLSKLHFYILGCVCVYALCSCVFVCNNNN